MDSESSLPCSQNPPLVPILTQMRPVHAFSSYFPKIYSNIIFEFTRRVSEWFLHRDNICWRTGTRHPLSAFILCSSLM